MKTEIVFEPFYRAVANSLMEKSLVDKVEITSEYLVVRDAYTGKEFKFTLLVCCLNENGG